MEVIKYLSIAISLLFASCSKNFDITPPYYLINVTNNYFEPIDSIMIGSCHFGSLNINQSSTIEALNRGAYKLRCKTSSNLIISANILLQGTKKDIQIIFKSDGSISIK